MGALLNKTFPSFLLVQINISIGTPFYVKHYVTEECVIILTYLLIQSTGSTKSVNVTGQLEKLVRCVSWQAGVITVN